MIAQYRAVHDLNMRRGEDDHGRAILKDIPAGTVLGAGDLTSEEIEKLESQGSVKRMSYEDAQQELTREAQRDVDDEAQKAAAHRRDVERRQAEQRREVMARYDVAMREELNELGEQQRKELAALPPVQPRRSLAASREES